MSSLGDPALIRSLYVPMSPSFGKRFFESTSFTVLPVPYVVILNPHNKKTNHVNLIKLLLFLPLPATHKLFYISSCHIQCLQAFS